MRSDERRKAVAVLLPSLSRLVSSSDRDAVSFFFFLFFIIHRARQVRPSDARLIATETLIAAHDELRERSEN